MEKSNNSENKLISSEFYYKNGQLYSSYDKKVMFKQREFSELINQIIDLEQRS